MKNIKDKRIRLLDCIAKADGGFPKRKWVDHGINPDEVTEWAELPNTGGEKIATAPTKPVWAYYRSLSGSEFFAAAAVQAKEEVIFTVNWQRGIAPRMAVMFRGDMYDITRVDALEGYRGDVKLYCKRVTAG